MSDRPNDWVVDEGSSLDDPFAEESSDDGGDGVPGGSDGGTDSDSVSPGQQESSGGQVPESAPSGHPAEATSGGSSEAELQDQLDRFDNTQSSASASGGTGTGESAENMMYSDEEFSDYGNFDDEFGDLDSDSSNSNVSTLIFIIIGVLWVFMSVCGECM